MRPWLALKSIPDSRRGVNCSAALHRRMARRQTPPWPHSTPHTLGRYPCSMPPRWRSRLSSRSRSRARCSRGRALIASTTFTPTCRTGIKSRSSASQFLSVDACVLGMMMPSRVRGMLGLNGCRLKWILGRAREPRMSAARAASAGRTRRVLI